MARKRVRRTSRVTPETTSAKKKKSTAQKPVKPPKRRHVRDTERWDDDGNFIPNRNQLYGPDYDHNAPASHFVMNSVTAQQYIDLVKSAIFTASDGSKRLSNVILTPLDKNVLWWWRKHDSGYPGPKFKDVNGPYPIPVVKDYHRDQVKCQILLTSRQIKTGALTVRQAADNLAPYTGSKLMESIVYPTMAKIGTCTPRRLTRPESGLAVARFCRDVNHERASQAVKALGEEHHQRFVEKVNNWEPSDGVTSPFATGAKPVMPRVHYPKSDTGNVRPVIASNRKHLERTSQQIWDSHTLSVRNDLFKALSWYDKKADRLAALVTYGHMPMKNMICAYMKFNEDTRFNTPCLTGITNGLLADALYVIVFEQINTPLGFLTGADVFGEANWSKVDAARLKAIKNILDKRASLPIIPGEKDDVAYGDAKWWKMKATAAILRETGVKPVDKKWASDLATSVAHQYELCNRQCVKCHEPIIISQDTSNINKPSIDRIKPGIANGKYTLSNIQLLCVACNIGKLWYLNDEAQVLIETAARAPWLSSACGKWIKPTVVKSKPIEKNVLTRLIMPWIQTQIRSIQDRYLVAISPDSNRKIKEVTLTEGDVLDMIRARYIGDGQVEDVAGIQGSVRLMSIDRIDQSKGYHPDNVRLILLVLNLIRRDCKDDERTFYALKQWRKNSDKIVADSNCFMPLHKQTLRVINGDEEATRWINRVELLNSQYAQSTEEMEEAEAIDEMDAEDLIEFD